MYISLYILWGFPEGSDGKESACNVADLALILDWDDPMEKEMATHSSILAWRIPLTEVPGGLQPVGSHTLLSHKEESDLPICNNMDGPRGYYVVK